MGKEENMAFISIMMNPQIKFIVERCKWETIYPTAKALMHL